MRMKTKLLALAALCCASTQILAQPADSGTLRLKMSFHGVSAPLSELVRNQVPVLPGNGQLLEDKMETLYEEPLAPALRAPAQPFVQSATPKPFAATAGLSFEGPGTGLAGFALTGAPPDMTLAVGPNHIVAWVNSQYAVFSKTGALLLGPVNGNTLFTGLPNVCASTNRGDPILQYDRLAARWILSQFAFAAGPSAPYLQCFAVSTSSDPTGSYVRYSVDFGSVTPSGFNDYGKLGVWPDGYYTSYNIFGGSPAGGNTGAGLCVSDRVKMLAGDASATTLCAPIAFYGGGGSFLPADLDGTTLPSDLSQGGLFLRLSIAPALRIIKLKPNFAAGTVTVGNGFGGASGSVVDLPLPATTRACNGSGGTCIRQPGTTNLLDTLADRLMYRLAFRNRSGVESMVVTHSVDPDAAGARGAALRWYEIRNPLGNPTDPVLSRRPSIFQNSTFDPGSTGDRWMGSIAMDRFGNMMMGYSLANVAAGPPGLKPSIAIAGRQIGDPLNILQAEIVALTGSGSQTGTLTRWGDYSTIQVDPVDDATFWFISQYLNTDGSFNWRTRIVSYRFLSTTLAIGDVSVVEGNAGSSNATFTITRNTNIDAVSVQVNTSNGTASAGSDYTAVVAQTVNFSSGGALTATVSVPIAGDTVLEPNETFSVDLSAPVGATLADSTALGTISNDDAASIAISDQTRAEGNAGNTAFPFTITLTGAVQGGFTLAYSSANGTATAGSDYAAVPGGASVAFTGAAGETRTATVQVTGDTVPEPDETFTVALGSVSNAAITVSDALGLGTISNDDLDADVAVAISDSRTLFPPGARTVYSVTVSNLSTLIDVAAVNTTQTVPGALTNISWTCSGVNGATCPPSGTGAIAQTQGLPRGSELRFRVSATVAAGSANGATVATAVTATVQAPNSDPASANNSATDTNTVNTDIIFADGFQ